jgi:hypothetical protein
MTAGPWPSGRLPPAGRPRAFFASTELRDGMQQAGVEGKPRIEIYQDA